MASSTDQYVLWNCKSVSTVVLYVLYVNKIKFKKKEEKKSTTHTDGTVLLS